MGSAFESYLRAIEKESIEALRRLVEVNSFTGNREGVVRVGEMCAEMFAPLGFEARRVRSVTAEAGDHLLLHRAGSSPEGAILVSHMDTVYPAEQEERDDFRWREEGERIFGPGVADMKGGTIVLWMALSALAEADPGLFERCTWKVLFNASEEGGCADFRGLAREQVGTGDRACLVYEPSFRNEEGVPTIAVARKGAGRFLVEVIGREAHSGNDHAAGASAVRELARIVEKIESLTDYERHLTFNVGVARGGTAVNAVPGRAMCLVDMRARTAADGAWGREQVLSLAGEGTVRSRNGWSACRIEVRERPGYPPWEPNEASDHLAALAVECAKELGQALVPVHRNGASDASHLYDRLPTVDGLGPLGRNTHCSVRDPAGGREQESAERPSFVPRALLSVALLRRVLA